MFFIFLLNAQKEKGSRKKTRWTSKLQTSCTLGKRGVNDFFALKLKLLQISSILAQRPVVVN